MVNEDTGQVFANGAVEQYGCNRTVNATRKTEDYAVVAQLLLEFSNGCVHKRSCAPVLTATADVDHKVLQQEAALKRMEYFWVELNAPQFFIVGLVGGITYLRGGGNAVEIFRNGSDGVAVAHPYL